MAEPVSTQPQPIPQSLSHLIQLNVEYSVLICMGNGCRCAVSPASISRHLRSKHHVPIELRKQVDRYVQGFPVNYDFTNVKLPQERSAPQPIIRIVSGFQCKHCPALPFTSQSRDAIKKHGNKDHNMKRIADKDLFDLVKLQSWFWVGRERYWVVDESKQPGQPARIHEDQEVDQNSGNSEGSQHHDSDGQGEVDDKIVQKIEGWRTGAKKRRLTLLEKAPVDEADPWLRYTQWNKVLSQSKHNIITTNHFTREPDAEELELVRVLRAWRRVLERCLDTLAASDHRDTLKWWASPKNDVASQRPFELPQNHQTIGKYSGLYQRFLCYVMRTAPRTWEEESETGVTYTESQLDIIDEMRTILRTALPEGEEDSILTTELMRFCMAVVMQDMSKVTVYESPLMHFLAVMGVDTQNKTLRSSFCYTPILAGVL